MRTVAQAIGFDAEALVARRLATAGWTILGRNVHVGRAEIDILAIEPACAALVAVEVRWRARRDYGLAEETISRAKLSRLRAAVFRLRDGKGGIGRLVPRLPVRIDVVAVEPGGVVRHHRGVA